MNIKENPNLESVKAKRNFRTNLIRAGAGTAAAFIALTSVGCDQIYATKPTTTITETTPGETTPGETTPEITTNPTTETTSTINPTTETTITPTTRPTTEATTVPTTTETKSELDGIPAERLQFVKDLLNIYENSLSARKDAFNKVDDYLTREQIINYGKTGEYNNIENFSIISHKDGKPALALINCQDNVVSGLKEAIKRSEGYDPNFLKKLTDNGMRSFIINRFDENIGFIYTFNKEGQFVWNISQEGLKTETSYMSDLLPRPLYTESLGIKMLNLGGDYSEYVGYFKEGMAAYCWWNLYLKTNDSFCQTMAHTSYMMAKVYYGQEYSPSVAFKSEKIQNLFDKIFDEDLAAFFGGTADEINENRKTMPDWNK